MTKVQLINEVAKVTSSKKEAELAVSAALTAIQNAHKKGDAITLAGFGTLSISERKAHTGWNQQTGEVIQMPAVSFLD